MGWPNNDPEGWAEVERMAVETWLRAEQFAYSHDWLIGKQETKALLEWLQAEQSDIFQAMLTKVSLFRLTDAEADYLERKFSTGAEE